MKKALCLGLVIIGSFFLTAQTAQAITITEFTVELNADPGETIARSVEIYDDALKGATVYPVVLNFRQDPEQEGVAQIITDPDQLKPDRTWMKYDVDHVDLPADGSRVPFPYRIEVPPDADPGTHLISLVFQTLPPEASGETTVRISSQVVTNFFIKIAGATRDAIDLTFKVGEFTKHDASLAPAEQAAFFREKTFFLKPPVEFLVKIANTGNTHQKPDGNVKIYKDLFGSGVVDQFSVNRDNRIIVPGGSRTFSLPSFGQGLMIGKYRAKLTMIYGDPLRDATKEVTFWIIPVVELAIALGALIIIIVLTVIIRKIVKRRRDKREANKEAALKSVLKAEIRKLVAAKPIRKKTKAIPTALKKAAQPKGRKKAAKK